MWLMRKIMSDQMFNELLDAECRAVGMFYYSEAHYEPYEYAHIAGDGPAGTAITYDEVINPGDTDLVPLMRRLGARSALDRDGFDAQAIFVVQAALAIRPGELGKGPERMLTIYGVTADGRSNLAVLQPQWDEDGRIWAVPAEVYHWGASNFTIDVLPYLEFFRVHDDMRAKVAA